MNDEFIVSNIKKATSLYVLVFVQDKITAVITNVPSKNKEVLTALLVKSLFLSLGASKVSLTNLSPVESLSSTNASIASLRATTTFVNKKSS